MPPGLSAEGNCKPVQVMNSETGIWEGQVLDDGAF